MKAIVLFSTVVVWFVAAYALVFTSFGAIHTIVG